MSSRRVPFRFHPAYRELPAQWRTLSYLQRSVLQDIWRLSDDDCSGRVETSGDPVAFLARALDIADRRDRRSVTMAIRNLFEIGLLSKDDGTVTVQNRGLDVRQASVKRPLDAQKSEVCGRLTAHKPAESLEPGPVERKNRTEQKERSAGVPAHIPAHIPARDFIPERRPLPEVPADVPPPEPPLAKWIGDEHARRFIARTGTQPGGAGRFKQAAKVAEWVEGNSEAYRLSNQALSAKILDGLFRDPKATEKRWPLWLASTDPHAFCGYPAGVQTQLDAAKPLTPLQSEGAAHLQRMESAWKAQVAAHDAPAHIRGVCEQRDFERPRVVAKYDLGGTSVDRETAAQWNECIATKRREYGEKLACWKQQAEQNPIPDEPEEMPELSPPPEPRLSLVSNSNEGPKPPKRGVYRPKTPEELEARRQELQRQEAMIRAANAAK